MHTDMSLLIFIFPKWRTGLEWAEGVCGEKGEQYFFQCGFFKHQCWLIYTISPEGNDDGFAKTCRDTSLGEVKELI